MSLLPESFSGAKCIVYGLGRSNLALCRLLLSEGAEIYLKDGKIKDDELLSKAEKEGIRNVRLYNCAIRPDFLFRSPGIRPDDGFISDAVSNETVLTSETELFFDRVRCETFGITGSDGKTTTTLLTANLLKKEKKNGGEVFVGGNIGTPLVSFLAKIKENDTVVAELSSFQLMTIKKGPDRAAITNISENHLDYHKSMTEYVASKANILNNCRFAVIKRENQALFSERQVETEVFSAYSGNDGLYLRDGNIIHDGIKILDTRKMVLKGKHNVENFMAAAALSGARAETVENVAENFAGVPHRMEFVREFSGIKFYNSSIDSTPSRSIATLSCFEKPLVVLCGGYDKKLDYSAFVSFAAGKADFVVTTGSTGKTLCDGINNCGGKAVFVSDFTEAVLLAAEKSIRGGSVVLSPACASFDRFRNFEERGDFYKSIVISL